MSWSYKITILYLGFVALIVSMVFISSNNKEELVAKDYYAKELVFQEKINAINNEKALNESIEHTIGENSIALALPPSIKPGAVNGEIYFYCPSASARDLKIKMEFNGEGKQVIQKNLLKPGVYKMELWWKAGNENYFKEEVINIK